MEAIYVNKRGKEPIAYLVDNEDFSLLKNFKWCIDRDGYARRNSSKLNGGKQHSIAMHRVIMWCPKGMVIDHIDGDKLNNQKSNLRIATVSQNCANRGKIKNNTSGFKGVVQRGKKWRAQLKSNGVQKQFGSFNTPEEAYSVYVSNAKREFGEFFKK